VIELRMPEKAKASGKAFLARTWVCRDDVYDASVSVTVIER
jgi:hypothetical protein